jgi:hypothetical protein
MAYFFWSEHAPPITDRPSAKSDDAIGGFCMTELFKMIFRLGITAAFVLVGATAAAGEDFLLGPPQGNGPVTVQIGFRLTEINGVDEENETFDFGGVLTQRWQDDRQAFDAAEFGVDEKIYQGNFQFNEVFTGWWPQVVLANQSGAYDRQGVLLRIGSDGSMMYTEALSATAKTRMKLRRFPFDQQHFEAIFGVLGFDKSQVVLELDPHFGSDGAVDDATISQWKSPKVQTSIREYDFNMQGRTVPVTAFIVGLDMTRRPVFMLRLTIIPLMILVSLSWSVFWMDRSSLGERMDISFLGILTIVAYQIMFGDILPKISYTTLMTAFLFGSFLTMCATVAVNLTVGHLDRSGRSDRGDRLDHFCRIASSEPSR